MGTQDGNGYTAVHAAASWGHLGLLADLLARDPSAANVVDFDNDTPLHYVAQATELGDRVGPILDELFRAGADATLKNVEDQTPVDVAQENLYLGFLEHLEKVA